MGFARGCARGARVLRASPLPRGDVLPVYREAGIRLDGGPEFGRAFSAKCLELGIEHPACRRAARTSTPSSSASGSCLHLHYRTAFRFRYYQSAAAIDADL